MENTPAPPRNSDSDNGVIRLLDKAARWSSFVFQRAAILGIAAMIIVTLIDVLGSKIPPLFHRTPSPLRAGTEMVYFSQLVAMAGALAYTKMEGGHIRLEFVDSLPTRIKSIFTVLVSILGLGLFVLLAWKSFEFGQTLRSHNDVTAAARVPIFPFAYWLALCCVPLCVVLLRDLAKALVALVKK